MGEEKPNMAPETYKRKHADFEALTLDKIFSDIDCWVCRSFINISSIKSATAFVNFQNKKQVIAQAYAVRIAKYIYSERYFQGVVFKDFFEQYHVTLDAIEEEIKFEGYTESSEWPTDLTTVH